MRMLFASSWLLDRIFYRGIFIGSLIKNETNHWIDKIKLVRVALHFTVRKIRQHLRSRIEIKHTYNIKKEKRNNTNLVPSLTLPYNLSRFYIILFFLHFYLLRKVVTFSR